MTDEERALMEGYQLALETSRRALAGAREVRDEAIVNSDRALWERDQARAGLAAMTKLALDWEATAGARLVMLRRAHAVLDGCVHEACRRPGDLLSELEEMLGLDA